MIEYLLIFGLLFLILSFLYYNFINFLPKSKETLILFSSAVSAIGLIFYIFITKNPVLSPLYFLILAFIMFLYYIKTRLPKCIQKEKIGEINGIAIYLCRTKEEYSNAWYNSKEKTIYVTERLKNILNEKELEVVLKHEIGHSNNKFLMLRVLSISSILFLPIVVIAYFLLAVSPKAFAIYVELLLLFILISVSSSLLLWIEEHEADRNAVESDNDVKNFIKALIKIEMDRYLGRYRPFVDIEIKKIESILGFNFDKKYDFLDFLKDFISYFVKYIILSITDILHRAPVLTHPLTKFRIMYLVNVVNALNKGQKFSKEKVNNGRTTN